MKIGFGSLATVGGIIANVVGGLGISISDGSNQGKREWLGWKELNVYIGRLGRWCCLELPTTL